MGGPTLSAIRTGTTIMGRGTTTAVGPATETEVVNPALGVVRATAAARVALAQVEVGEAPSAAINLLLPHLELWAEARAALSGKDRRLADHKDPKTVCENLKAPSARFTFRHSAPLGFVHGFGACLSIQWTRARIAGAGRDSWDGLYR